MDTLNLTQYQLDTTPQSLEGQRLYDKISSLGASDGDLLRVFNNAGQFIPINGLEGWWSLDPDKLADHLLVLFNGHYELQQVVLNKLIPTGFNDHGPTHIERVTRQTLRILKEGGYDHESQRIGVIAASCHDLGNMIDRKDHHIWSCQIAKQILGLSDNKKLDRQVLEAIYFHEEKAHKDHNLINQLPPPAQALILADKTDVSYLRVHSASDMKEAIEDLHVVINFMVDDTKLNFYGTKTQWRLLFTPSAERVQGMFLHLLKHDERKWVPREWQEMYRTEQIEYIFMFYAKILKIYLERIRLSALASLSLFPQSKKFEFVVEDQERHVLIKREFHRDSSEAQIEELRYNLVKNS